MRQNRFLTAVSFAFALFCLFVALTTSASAASEEVIYSFQGGSDGAYPYSDLVADAAGNLYGTTEYGGTDGDWCNIGCGTVFELAPTKDGWRHQVLYRFNGNVNDGYSPQAGVVFDGAGNLYGTTTGGGSYNAGTVFELAPTSQGGWTKSIIYNFTGGTDGAYPATDLVFDAHGDIFGTAATGGCGNHGCGAATPGRVGPAAPQPCDDGCGTVFELTPQVDGSWTETTLHVFTAAPDGGVPSSRLILDSAGNVYGITEYGGTGSCGDSISFAIGGCGIIYELTPNSGGTWTETILYNFARGYGFGVYPSGELLSDNDGHLYGTAQSGGDGFGTVFEFGNSQKKGWQQNSLHIFYKNPDGTVPVGGVVVGREHDLLGVTSSGGTNGAGIVFQLQPAKDGWKETILHSFGGSGDGATPQAGLVFDRNGDLYGTTQYGGTGSCSLRGNNGCGTVYEATP